jgi:hypothetical protein
MILQKALEVGQAIFPEYENPETGLPDLAFVLKLPDETLMSSNLYAVQKMLEGPFQFDVYYESGSGKHHLDCMVFHSERLIWLTYFLVQPILSLRASQLSNVPMRNASTLLSPSRHLTIQATHNFLETSLPTCLEALDTSRASQSLTMRRSTSGTEKMTTSPSQEVLEWPSPRNF